MNDVLLGSAGLGSAGNERPDGVSKVRIEVELLLKIVLDNWTQQFRDTALLSS